MRTGEQVQAAMEDLSQQYWEKRRILDAKYEYSRKEVQATCPHDIQSNLPSQAGYDVYCFRCSCKLGVEPKEE
jgi:hypothetical protein